MSDYYEDIHGDQLELTLNDGTLTIIVHEADGAWEGNLPVVKDLANHLLNLVKEMENP